jgi:hypothetical protein
MEYLLDYYSSEETEMVENSIGDTYTFCCRRPDTLMPNACGVCGAYLEDGLLGCTEERCVYQQRRAFCRCILEDAVEGQGEGQGEEEPLPPLRLEVEEPLPLLRLEEVKVRAGRVPKEAEHFWPYMRAKRLIKFLPLKTESKRPSYLELLEIIAKRAGITQEQLYKTSPHAYFDKIRHGTRTADAFMRPIRRW